PLQVLERDVRIEHRVLVVEARDEPERDEVVGQRVDEPAAELLHLERTAHRVDDAARLLAAGRPPPQFLDPDAIYGRALPLVEPQPPDERLREIAADAVG